MSPPLVNICSATEMAPELPPQLLAALASKTLGKDILLAWSLCQDRLRKLLYIFEPIEERCVLREVVIRRGTGCDGGRRPTILQSNVPNTGSLHFLTGKETKR